MPGSTRISLSPSDLWELALSNAHIRTTPDFWASWHWRYQFGRVLRRDRFCPNGGASEVPHLESNTGSAESSKHDTIGIPIVNHASRDACAPVWKLDHSNWVTHRMAIRLVGLGDYVSWEGGASSTWQAESGKVGDIESTTTRRVTIYNVEGYVFRCR